MSYIFSSNGNNYTFRKLDSMLINMPEKDGQHVLVRQTINNTPTYSWTDAAIIVKVNQAFIFEYIPASTESVECKFDYNLNKGNYLVTTMVTYYTNEELFNDCESIQDVLDRGYFIKVNLGPQMLLNSPVIDSLNNLFTSTQQTVIAHNEEQTTISVETNIASLVMLKGLKSISIVFEQLELLDDEI